MSEHTCIRLWSSNLSNSYCEPAPRGNHGDVIHSLGTLPEFPYAYANMNDLFFLKHFETGNPF